MLSYYRARSVGGWRFTVGRPMEVRSPRWKLASENIHGSGCNEGYRKQRDQGLQQHDQLCAMGEGERIGRAEGGRIGCRHIQIIHEGGAPARWRDFGIENLGK